jgi:hypothetical protein
MQNMSRFRPKMTNEEFYARALLAALPLAFDANKPSQTTTRDAIASLAHEYAAALTAAYRKSRKLFPEES